MLRELVFSSSNRTHWLTSPQRSGRRLFRQRYRVHLLLLTYHQDGPISLHARSLATRIHHHDQRAPAISEPLPRPWGLNDSQLPRNLYRLP